MLHRLFRAGHDRETALIGTLLALIEYVADTNLLWRGGEPGLTFARELLRLVRQRARLPIGSQRAANRSRAQRLFITAIVNSYSSAPLPCFFL